MSARDLVAALGGKMHGAYGTAQCPAHNDKTPSLQISDGESAILLTCHAGCERRDVIDALKARGFWHDSEDKDYIRPERVVQRGPSESEVRRMKFAQELWKRGVPPQNTLVETYLKSRGITSDLPPSIRYLASAKHAETGLYLPCMLAGVTRWPSREVIAVHRTFLKATGDGKAPVTSPKLTLGPMSGNAIRLAAATETLGLSEGIETGLSAMQMYGVPVWAAYSAGNMERVIIPASVKRVVIYADSGGPGERAAKAAARSFYAQGRDVEISHPPSGHDDFNDYHQSCVRGAA